MTITVSDFLRSYRIQGVLNALDSAGTPSCLIYSGTQPSNCGTLLGDNVLLATVLLNSPCGYITSNVFNLYTGVGAIISNSGTATWARFKTGGGSIVFDCDVSLAAGSAMLKLNTVTLVATQYFYIQGLSLAEV